ncbi:MAG: hypothetical protein LBN07_02985 [Christensenellaceae bacterium]|nr:hypothetical protein [Christensenellaceae bacterium]
MTKFTKKWVIGAVVLAVIVCAVTLPFLHLGQQQGDSNSGEVRQDGVIYRPRYGGMFVAGATKETVMVQSVINNTPVCGVLTQALKNNTITHTVQFLGEYEQFLFGVGAFENSQVTKLLNIPAVSLFDTGALRLMPRLDELSAQQSDNVFVLNGILYQKNSTVTTLVKVPVNMTVLPANYAKNVSVVASGAFDYSKVSVVDLPSTMMRLESEVFTNSNVVRIILRHKSTIMPVDVIAPITKELEVLVDAKDQIGFRDYYNGGAAFLRQYGLYMHPLSEGYNTGSRVHCVGSHISIAGYTYTINRDGKTITVDLGGGTKLTNVDAWYIL